MNTKLTYFLWILLIGPLLVYGQKKARMDHILRISEIAYERAMASQNQNGSARSNDLKAIYHKSLKKEGEEEIILAIAEFNGPIRDIEGLGVKVGSQIGNYLTLEIPIEKITALSHLDGMIAMEAAREVHYNLDDARAMIRADEANDFLNYEGQGVIIGLVDTGIDIAHPSFKNTDETTRILSIWDQEGTGGAPFPFNYGREWTASQINAGTCTHTDVKGHGTGMAGIAAGNGRQAGGTTPYIGVAPKADIIMVAGKRTYNNFNEDISTLTSTIIDGVSYISQKAESLGKPWVVNLSLGLNAGPRNGTSLFERAISEFVNSGAGEGRVIVTSAGNKGFDADNVNKPEQNRIHMDGSGAKTLQFTINGSAPRSAKMEIYYPSGSSYSFTLTSPNGKQYGPVSPGNWLDSFDDPTDGAIIVDNMGEDLFYYQGTDHLCVIDFNDYQGTTPAIPLATGQWTLQVSSGSGTWDAYLINGNGNTTTYFELNSYTNRRIISEPGNAANVITVGSINSKNTWNNLGGTADGYPIGEVSFFSSPGPSRSGLTKPDI